MRSMRPPSRRTIRGQLTRVCSIQSGQLQLLFSSVLPPVAIPSTLVVDANGNIAARVVGETNY